MFETYEDMVTIDDVYLSANEFEEALYSIASSQL